MFFIYILKCEQNKYYIGKTKKDPKIRYQKHINGRGSVWTKKYKPINIISIYKNCDAYDEDKYTKIYMEKYGIDNVRGGSYTTNNLSEETKNFLQKEIDSAQDKCRGCGQIGHFYRYCPNKHKNKNNNISNNNIHKIKKDVEEIKNMLNKRYTHNNKPNANILFQERIGYNLFFVNKIYKEGQISKKEKDKIKNCLINNYIKNSKTKGKTEIKSVSITCKISKKDSIAFRVSQRRRKR